MVFGKFFFFLFFFGIEGRWNGVCVLRLRFGEGGSAGCFDSGSGRLAATRE